MLFEGIWLNPVITSLQSGRKFPQNLCAFDSCEEFIFVGSAPFLSMRIEMQIEQNSVSSEYALMYFMCHINQQYQCLEICRIHFNFFDTRDFSIFLIPETFQYT